MRAEAEKPAMGALLRGAIENLTASLSSTKARKEALWVVGHKAVEFILIFVAIKVFTSLMGVEVYGEYSLALTGAMLAAHMLVLPVHHTYLRYHHQAIEAGVGRSAGLSLIRWLAVVPLAVALLAFISSRSMGTMLGLGEWTILATALIFLGNR